MQWKMRLALCAGVLLTLAVNGTAAVPARVHPVNQVPPQTAGRIAVGRLPVMQRMSVTIVLPLRNEADLDRLIVQQADRTSPVFLRYLTPQEFGNRFGPTPAEYQSVRRYLASMGLRITGDTIARTCITAEGAAASVERALDVQINQYLVNGRVRYANDRNPSLPASLGIRGLVSVQGLTDTLEAHPMDNGIPPFTPVAIDKIYNDSALQAAGYTGKGQTIAVYSLADYNPSNVTYYAANVNKTVSTTPATYDASHITRVPIDGGTTTYSEEADLDLELVLGSAPDAQIQLWLGANNSNAVFDIFQQFVNQTAIKIMTSSWGVGEEQLTASDFNAFNQVFKQAAAQGQTVFSSSGDKGSNETSSGAVGVSYWASDPYVVAVGGTNLFTKTDNTYDHETGWGGTQSGSVVGSGGGLSTFFTIPSWQAGPGVNNANSNGKRQLPDVSMNASPSTGYLVYFTYNGATNWYYGGGTSASAPEWASAMLLIQQAIGKSFFFSPILYQIYQKVNGGAPFHDVTVGNNGAFSCTPNWDYVTGCGSVDFGGLWNQISLALAPGTVGDLNGDNVVDYKDVQIALNIAGGLVAATPTQTQKGDLNGNGVIDTGDAVIISRMAHGLSH